MTALIDQIEMVGLGVEAGLIGREDGAELLSALSDGGLTVLGARDAIDNHREMRDRYERIGRHASRMVILLTAVQDATSDEERDLRWAAANAEMDQRLAAMRAAYQRLYGGDR